MGVVPPTQPVAIGGQPPVDRVDKIQCSFQGWVDELATARLCLCCGREVCNCIFSKDLLRLLRCLSLNIKEDPEGTKLFRSTMSCEQIVVCSCLFLCESLLHSCVEYDAHV